MTQTRKVKGIGWVRGGKLEFIAPRCNEPASWRAPNGFRACDYHLREYAIVGSAVYSAEGSWLCLGAPSTWETWQRCDHPLEPFELFDYLGEAREWLLDAWEEAQGPDAFGRAPQWLDGQVFDAIERLYPGGWVGFVEDAS